MWAAAASSTISSAAISAAAASRAARCLPGPSSASSAVGDDALDVPVELQPPGADRGDLAAEALLEHQLGLEPAAEVAEPGADGGEVVSSPGRSRSALRERARRPPAASPKTMSSLVAK